MILFIINSIIVYDIILYTRILLIDELLTDLK